MTNPFADIVENQIADSNVRISFDEMCSFYAALKLGVRPRVVAIASGLALSTISHLRAAGFRAGGQMRYPKVGREYRSLGHDAFIHKYATPIIRERLAVAADQFKRKQIEPKTPGAISIRAKRRAGRHDWPETSIGLHAVFLIVWSNDPPGWFWRNLKPRQDLPEIEYWDSAAVSQTPLLGDPNRDNRGFATSEDCYRHVKNYLDPKQE